MTTELQQIEQVPEGELVCLPVAEHDALTALVRDLAASDPTSFGFSRAAWCRFCGHGGTDEAWPRVADRHYPTCPYGRAWAIVARWDAAEPVQP